MADCCKFIEILQEHHCKWLTTDEEYDTTTANGRLYINVKLSTTQNEADIDGERIDVVFDSKISRDTVVSGNCPFGYYVNSDKYESTVSQRGITKYTRCKFLSPAYQL